MHTAWPVSTCETLKRSVSQTSRLADGPPLRPSCLPASRVLMRGCTAIKRASRRDRSKAGVVFSRIRRRIAIQLHKIEYSSGAWTRTRTTQLQRLVGCQLPNAGSTLCYGNLREPRPSTHDTGRTAVAVSADPWVSKGSSGATRLACDVLPCPRLPSLRSCGKGLRRGRRRCAGSRDSSPLRFSARSSGYGASAPG
jgi:hypothetical protein